ncbi:MAG: 30S ribosomal protein S2 [Candidatus Falkowbacteria bacterium]|nr:30S ribosomal protein S2 [Candidatus Falkowbacteria bacterium]
MQKIPTLEAMLKAGLHFGHRTSRWHPKMKPYIYTQKNGIHIINLAITQKSLEEAIDYMAQLMRENKTILFACTKVQSKEGIKKLAIDLKMPYITEKWMGGTLTNFSAIKKIIKKYTDLLAQKQAGKLTKYTKREQLEFDKDIAKLELKVGGLVNLTKVPDALFIWDIKKELTAVKEAVVLNIPIIAICDSNVNPSKIKYVIPANDDSTKGLELIAETIKENLISTQK